MAIPALTEWDAKVQAHLLAEETLEWREMRLVAEKPDTRADLLTCFDEAMTAHWARNIRNSDYETHNQPDMLAEALAAHPKYAAFYFGGTHRSFTICNPCILP